MRSLDGPEESSSDVSSDWEIISPKEETLQGNSPDTKNDSVEVEDDIIDLTRDLELQTVSPPPPDLMAGIGYWESPGNSPTPIHNGGSDRDVVPSTWETQQSRTLEREDNSAHATTTRMASGELEMKEAMKRLKEQFLAIKDLPLGKIHLEEQKAGQFKIFKKMDTMQSFPEISQDYAGDVNVLEREIIDLTRDLELQTVSPPPPDLMAGIGYWESPGNSPTPIHVGEADRDVVPSTWESPQCHKREREDKDAQPTTSRNGRDHFSQQHLFSQVVAKWLLDSNGSTAAVEAGSAHQPIRDSHWEERKAELDRKLQEEKDHLRVEQVALNSMIQETREDCKAMFQECLSQLNSSPHVKEDTYESPPKTSQDDADDSDDEESEFIDLTQDLELQFDSPPRPDRMAGIGYGL